MRSALRIALTYFSVVPLQGWLGGIGAALMLFGVLARLAGSDPAALGLLVFGLILAAPVSIVTVLTGGAMLRGASTRTVLHLRPHGREQMLLGAFLAITLIAAVATWCVLQLGVRVPINRIAPLSMFAMIWSGVSLIWLLVFVASGSRLFGLLICFVPCLLVPVARTFPIGLPALRPLIIASLVAWVAVAVWYMRTSSVAALPLGRWNGLQHAGGDALGEDFSRSGATKQILLGAPSAVALFMRGAFMLLFTGILMVVFLDFMVPSRGAAFIRAMATFFLVPVLMMGCASMGYALTRRARLLWLRTGVDRRALFTLAELSGLQGIVLTGGVAAIGLLAWSFANWPEHAPALALFAAGQLAFCLCLFHCGMSLTRGWSAGDVLLCLGMGATFAIEITVLRPWKDGNPGLQLGLLAALLLLAPLLRVHARRRWLALDWRIARLPAPMRAGG